MDLIWVDEVTLIVIFVMGVVGNIGSFYNSLPVFFSVIPDPSSVHSRAFLQCPEKLD